MTSSKKRNYHSEKRETQAEETKNRILEAAKTLFQSDGFECVTIGKIAQAAQVSSPTIYSLFQSKLGILRALLEKELPMDKARVLVEKLKREETAKGRLLIIAKITRQINEAEKAVVDIFRGASVLSPEFKTLEEEKENLRYQRQEDTVNKIVQENCLADGLTKTTARDILWAFTGRDMYRLFVGQKGWNPNQYEKWLGQLLVSMLLR